MALPKVIWDQLRATTATEIIRALLRDGWTEDQTRGATRVFVKESNLATHERVVIHYHPRKTYPPGTLKALLKDIGWEEDDLIRLKLIKKPPSQKTSS